jgi:putative addiction module component (TIGR02574 family)
MATTTDQHLNKLLELPVEERAKAARILLDSLDDGPADTGVAEAQASEIARRLQSLADGSAKLHDWDEVRERVRARLRAIRKP